VSRLLIHVEGQTEETFVNEVLAPHLHRQGYQRVSARLIGNARLRQRRGGIRAWSSVKTDIIRHLKEDPSAFATTLVDYYGLPRTGDKAWPSRDCATSLPFDSKATCVESALEQDLVRSMGADFDPRRFIPFVIMHEFESLLFSDCAAFSRGIHRQEMAAEFQTIRDAFRSPEEIDDSPETCPSRRILDLIPNYEKPLLGTLAVLEIGLPAIRAECPHFDQWVKRLEQALR
jgi:hypothetical protein